MKAGETLQIMCGSEVNNAQIITAWDYTEVMEKLDLESIKGLCSKCKKNYVPEIIAVCG